MSYTSETVSKSLFVYNELPLNIILDDEGMKVVKGHAHFCIQVLHSTEEDLSRRQQLE